MAKKPGTTAGISAGVKYWLFFMITLSVIGYSPFLSICMGAIGGIAAGLIAAFSNPKDYDKPEPQTQTSITTEPAIVPAKRARFRKYGSRQPAHRRHGHRSRPWSWLLGRSR